MDRSYTVLAGRWEIDTIDVTVDPPESADAAAHAEAEARGYRVVEVADGIVFVELVEVPC